MNNYELTVLIHPDLESELEKPLEKIRKLIANNGGEIAKEDNWGKKRMAYSINKEDFAVYVAMDIRLPATSLLKISNTLNITDEVLRYLLVKTDERAKAAAAAKEAEAEKE